MSRLADSTQRKHWTLPEEVVLKRREDVVEKRKASGAASFSCADEEALRHHHERRLLRLVVKCNLPIKVAATAITFFKRFYMSRSVLDHNPALIAVNSLYASSKVEEFPIEIDELIRLVDTVLNGVHDPKANPEGDSIVESVDQTVMRVTSEMVLEAELNFLSAINFQLICFHPNRSLLVLKSKLADAPEFPHLLEGTPDGGDGQKEPGASRSLEKLIRHAEHVVVCRTLFTDIMFSFAPALIAMAAVITACTDISAENRDQDKPCTDPAAVSDFLGNLLGDESKRSLLSELVNRISRMPDGNPTSPESLSALESRRREIGDLLNDPTSQQFKKRRLEELDAQDTKRRRVAAASRVAAEERMRQLLG